MEGAIRIVDADAHHIEPPTMWRDYIDPNFREVAPSIGSVRGRNVLIVEGESINPENRFPITDQGLLAAISNGMIRYREAARTGFSPTSRISDMDASGIAAQIIFPTGGGQLVSREYRDPELLSAICRAYNRWSSEYCRFNPERLHWAAMLPLQSPALAAVEARNAADLGCSAFYVNPAPVGNRPIHDAGYDLLWAVLESLQKPVCLHASGTSRNPSFGDRMETHTTSHICVHPFEAMAAMAGLIWFGVTDRFPKLRFVHVESDAGWLPYWIQRMTQHWEFSRNAEHPHMQHEPLYYFRQSFFVAARGDEMTLPHVVSLVGDDRVLFNTDYPHSDGTWPWGIEKLLAQNLAPTAKARILSENARELFNLVGLGQSAALP